jgi:hypothetical protein
MTGDDAEKLDRIKNQPYDSAATKVDLTLKAVRKFDKAEAKLWLQSLKSHPWIKNPRAFIDDLVDAKDTYFDSIPSGLILWFKSKGSEKSRTASAFGLTGKSAWVTSHITSGQFRYAPIELMAGKDYEHVKAQLG